MIAWKSSRWSTCCAPWRAGRRQPRATIRQLFHDCDRSRRLARRDAGVLLDGCAKVSEPDPFASRGVRDERCDASGVLLAAPQRRGQFEARSIFDAQAYETARLKPV